MSDKNLELKIVVRTVDEASKVIRQIKQEAARQVSGRGGAGGRSEEAIGQGRQKRPQAKGQGHLQSVAEDAKLISRMHKLGLKEYSHLPDDVKKALITIEEAQQQILNTVSEGAVLDSQLDERKLGHLKDLPNANKKAALKIEKEKDRRELVRAREEEVDSQLREFGITDFENFTFAQKKSILRKKKKEQRQREETIRLDSKLDELGIKGLEGRSNAEKKTAIATEEARQRRIRASTKEYKINSQLDEYGLGHLKDRSLAEREAALTKVKEERRRSRESKRSADLDKQAAELGIKWRGNLTNSEKQLEIAAHKRREAMRRASEQLIRFRLMDVAMGLRTLSTEAFVLGSSMLGVGVAVARASLQMNTALVRFQKTAEAIIGSKEAAQQLVAELTSFVIRSPFKTQEATESARKLIQVVGGDAVRYLEDLANLTAGSGGDQATLDRIITTFVQSYKDPRLMGYTTRSLTRNMVQYLALIRKGLEEEGKNLSEEQVSALINSSMSGKRFWELLLKGSKATFGPDIMKRLGENDPLFQWEMTIDHLLMKLHQLTGPFREWLLAVLKGVNSILDKFENAPGGLGAVLFSLGITASIVFGGMLVALSGILFMANLVVLSIIGIRSAMSALGASTLGELIAAGKAWVGGALSAGKAGAGGARSAGKALAGGALSVGKALAAGVIGDGGWTKGPGVFKRVRAFMRLGSLENAHDSLKSRLKAYKRTGLGSPGRMFSRYKAVIRLYNASYATAFAPVSTFSKLLSMLGVLIMIVKYWDKLDEGAKQFLKTVGAIYAVLKLMRVAVWLLEKGMLRMAARNIALFAALELANRNWGSIEGAIMTGEGEERRMRPEAQWALMIPVLLWIGREIIRVRNWLATFGGGGGAIAGIRFLIQYAIVSLLGSPAWIAAIVVAVVAALGYLIYRWATNREQPTNRERPTPRWMGGRFRAGEALLVGERGPEVVRFDKGGYVIPNHALRVTAARPQWDASIAAPAVTAARPQWRPTPVAPAVTAARPQWKPSPAAPAVTAKRPQLGSSSALTALTNVALAALRAPLPSVRNPGITTLFPWLYAPGAATRAIGPRGVTDFFEIEEQGGDVVIRVHNPYGALRRAGEGLMFR